MSRKNHISEDYSVAYIQNRGVVITTGITGLSPDSPKAPATKPKVSEDQDLETSGNIAAWGSSNTFPQDVVKDAAKDPFIYPLIDRKVRMLYGRGVEVGIEEYDDDGNPVFLRGPKFSQILDPVHEFHRTAGVNSYLWQSILDLYWFHNIFPQLITSNDHSVIANIHAPKAAECRWKVRKKGSLVSDTCYINSDWDGSATEENSIQLPVLDPFNFPEETLRSKESMKSFIFALSWPDPVRHYYSLAPWNVYRTSQWSEFVQKIPEFKVAMMKNAMLLRWHVTVNTEYWPWRFKEDWNKAQTDSALLKKLIDQVFQEIDELLVGASNAGKAIYTHVVRNNKTGTDVEMITFKRLDDNLKLGEIAEDSSEASSFAIFSFGLHPTLVGHAPGSAKSALGAGSGSDQRVAWNNYLAQCGLDIDLILSPLHFIREYNGWDPRIKWRFKHDMQFTQDNRNPNTEPQQTAS